MAKTTDKSITDSASEEVKTIEVHAREQGISLSILEGVKATMDWSYKKEVSKEDFIKATKEFLGNAIDGGRK